MGSKITCRAGGTRGVFWKRKCCVPFAVASFYSPPHHESSGLLSPDALIEDAEEVPLERCGSLAALGGGRRAPQNCDSVARTFGGQDKNGYVPLFERLSPHQLLCLYKSPSLLLARTGRCICASTDLGVQGSREHQSPRVPGIYGFHGLRP